MAIQESLEKMKVIQSSILDYLENDVANQEDFGILKDLFQQNNIKGSKNELKLFLYLLIKISNNHQRSFNFFNKIEFILQYIKTELKQYFSNLEIFNIFKSNKRILLILIEENLLMFDESIVKKITQDKFLKAKYLQYFAPEIKPFINEEWFLKKKDNKDEHNENESNEDEHNRSESNSNFDEINESDNDNDLNNSENDDEKDINNDHNNNDNFDEFNGNSDNENNGHNSDDDDNYFHDIENSYSSENKENLIIELNKELPTDFYEKRRIGENDGYICHLIQKDQIEAFVEHFNKINCSSNSTINMSIYETNSFLLKNKDISLIEYAAFYGAFQIFQYLLFNKAELNPSLWFYAIHGKNAEIIHLLEENQVEFPNESNEPGNKCIKESIKCHHNSIADYFLNNIQIEDDELFNVYSHGLRYYNFYFVKNEFINHFSFYELCEFDYCLYIDILLRETEIDVNKMTYFKTPEIQYLVFKWNFKSNKFIQFESKCFYYILNQVFNGIKKKYYFIKQRFIEQLKKKILILSNFC